MTTRYMKIHGDSLPVKKVKKSRKKYRKPIEVYGTIPRHQQASVIHSVLGWMDSPQYRTLAHRVVMDLHAAGYRIAKKSEVDVQKSISQRRRMAQKRVDELSRTDIMAAATAIQDRSES